MKKIYIFYFSFFFILFSTNLFAQRDSLIENFTDTSFTGWGEAPDWQGYFQFEHVDSALKVTTLKACGGKSVFTNFQFSFPAVDLTNHPFLSFKIKSSKIFTIRVDLMEQRDTTKDTASNWRTTNATPVKIKTFSDGLVHEFIFDFGGKFAQSWPNADSVNKTKITRMHIYLNPDITPALAANNTFYISDLRMGSIATKPSPDTLKNTVLLNQIGFESVSQKLAIVPGNISGKFSIKDFSNNNTVYDGTISIPSIWNYSNQIVRTIDFSSFSTHGTYYISLKGDTVKSSKFEINDCVYYTLATTAIRSYYYRRASIAIDSVHGGQWARAEGHPDTNVYVHASAASAERPEGTIISSPRGWYDAGDYNKYIVNSGISTYTLLALLEHYPDYFNDVKLNIPESSNDLPDLLDEILWNVRWMLTMQDPNDGGVYHKLTTKIFSSFVMPNKDLASRYVVQKTTAATLDFTAVMAVCARILKAYNTQLPGLADSCSNAAIAAWNWAKLNPSIYYSQPSDITTGAYGDGYVVDEFAWAGAEMYLATKQDSFMQNNNILQMISNVPNWSTVNTLGVISLAQHLSDVNPLLVDTAIVKNKIISLADNLYSTYLSSPFKISLTTFPWGSNAEICNESFILLQAYRLTKDIKYLTAAKANLDYILGKNPTGYCFITDFGNKSPKFIHDRQSGSDKIPDPVPGLMSGGPNLNPPSSQECPLGTYPSSFPALSYADNQCSFSTNEVAINWNAPFVYLTGSLCALNNCSGFLYGLKDKYISEKKMKVYPNPATNLVSVELPVLTGINSLIEIFDLNGKRVFTHSLKQNINFYQFQISDFNSGIYFIKISSDKNYYTSRLIKN